MQQHIKNLSDFRSSFLSLAAWTSAVLVLIGMGLIEVLARFPGIHAGHIIFFVALGLYGVSIISMALMAIYSDTGSKRYQEWLRRLDVGVLEKLLLSPEISRSSRVYVLSELKDKKKGWSLQEPQHKVRRSGGSLASTIMPKSKDWD